MFGVPIATIVFYIFVASLLILPCRFVWHYWQHANNSNNPSELRWINIDNRTMYVDALKTLITASGIAVALVASSARISEQHKDPIVETSARIAVVCLVSCVCLSLIAIMALLRGYELSVARLKVDLQRLGLETTVNTQGLLTNHQLLWILVPCWLSLCTFVIGFVFLGRIAFHF
jgi:hypothetical protein